MSTQKPKLSINIDNNDSNADWIKTRTWDLPRTVEGMRAMFGDDWREQIEKLPAWQAAPPELRSSTDAFDVIRQTLKALTDLYEEKRQVRDADYWGAPVGTPLPLPPGFKPTIARPRIMDRGPRRRRPAPRKKFRSTPTAKKREQALRMGAEFEMKRLTGEPIDAIDELSEMENYREMTKFILDHKKELGLRPPYKVGSGWSEQTYDEADILINAIARRMGSSADNKSSFESGTPDDREVVTELMSNYANNGTLMVAMLDGPALKILEGKERAKSQFETGRSNGAFMPATRAEMETAMYKIHPGVVPSKRHTYGYVSISGSINGNQAVAQYGMIRFELSSDLHPKTGITAGDSLGSKAVPIPMGEVPSPRAAHDAMRGWGGERFLTSNSPEEAEQHRYMEAQIQGGWDWTNIVKVHIPYGAYQYVADAAAKLGIPVEYYGTPKKRPAYKVPAKTPARKVLTKKDPENKASAKTTAVMRSWKKEK